MGCTGSPQDSHDIRWYTIHKDKLLRCGECGSGELYISCSAPKVEVNLLPAFFFFFFSLQVRLPWSGRRRARSPLNAVNGPQRHETPLPILCCLSLSSLPSLPFLLQMSFLCVEVAFFS